MYGCVIIVTVSKGSFIDHSVGISPPVLLILTSVYFVNTFKADMTSPLIKCNNAMAVKIKYAQSLGSILILNLLFICILNHVYIAKQSKFINSK
ncbi:hypothetical protein A4H97_33810 [Niastella yeongjuensis]|uniref:Uncharacterized protein n=1 Tax=Niastella yeongjuensis TaxID=354355 RepID=A0A1V9EBX4_9BACT|nr:hypothetical protein A4H97_33810 [Niastella yeongjuensis]